MQSVIDLCSDTEPASSQTPLYPDLRRCFLEICAFLSINSIENSVALVSRSWLQMSRDEELWKRKWLEERRPCVTPASGSYRAAFLDSQLGSCWHCGLYLNHFGSKCVELNRLLCLTCAEQPDCQVLSLTQIAERFNTQMTTFQWLKVPSFLVDFESATYLSLAVRHLRPYYERRRKLLLSLIQGSVSKTTLRKLQTFDFNKVFIQGASTMQALCHFCGRNESTEELSESVKTVLKQLKLRRIS